MPDSSRAVLVHELFVQTPLPIVRFRPVMSNQTQRPNYLLQRTQQSLADGLREYNAVYGHQLSMRHQSPKAATFFHNHDVAHVIFGCDLSLAHEAVVKMYSLFGTTAGFGVIALYAMPEAKEIYQKLTLREILATTLAATVLIPWTLYRCVRMTGRWPWDDHAELMHLPLSELRETFGIKVPGPA